jgi:hypothetical protein
MGVGKDCYGFGENIDELLPKFKLKTGNYSALFTLTTRISKEFVMLDVDSEKYRALVLKPCCDLANPHSVVLFPIMVNKNCLSLVYAAPVDR